MKKLGKDLKRMVTGLAYQNAGEFLSRREKIKTLEVGLMTSKPVSTVATQPLQKTLSK
jgi:hypothetical protein